jgi:hypothetical protein
MDSVSLNMPPTYQAPMTETSSTRIAGEWESVGAEERTNADSHGFRSWRFDIFGYD